MNKFSNIKYLIFDLDDTLLDKHHLISEFTANVLKDAQKHGYKIVFNTSRSKQHSQIYIDQVNPDYGIYNGGCQIVDKNGNDLYLNLLSKEKVCEVSKHLFKCCPKISVQTIDAFYASDKEYKAQNAQYFDFTNGLEKDAFKVLAFSFNKELMKDVAIKFDLEHQNYLHGPWNRFSAKGASKYLGIVKLMEILQDDIKNAACFGDDVGDYEMISKCGLGVAMANSQPELLNKVQNITLSNNEDGCAVFIVNNLLN